MKKRLSSLLVLAIVVLLVLAGCSNANNEPADADNQEPVKSGDDVGTPAGEFKIVGLEGGDVVITAEEIYKMESATEKMTNISSSGEITEAEVTGVKIDTILSKYNVSQKDFEGVRFYAADGYSIIVPKEILQQKEIMLIYKQDGKPLHEKHMPLRVAVPDERSMYWVGNVAGMEIVQEEIINISKVTLLESSYSLLTQEDYTYYETVDKAVKTEELFEKFASVKETDEISAKCVDGLDKNEKKNVFLTGYIKITGEYAPLFLSPELPKGMHMKELLWFNNAENAFFSIEQGLVKYADELVTIGEDTGILLTSIEDSVGLEKGNKYKLTADDGYSLEITREDFEKGMIYPRKKGGYSTVFEGLEDNTKVKGILSIEVTE